MLSSGLVDCEISMAPASSARDDRSVLANLWPLFGLTEQTSRLELRLPREHEIAELASIAATGSTIRMSGPSSPPAPPVTRWTGLVSSCRSICASSLQSPWVFCVLFPAWWTRYLNSASVAGPVQSRLSPLFLELSGYCVNAARLHVNAADVLVRRGIDGTASDNRHYVA